MSVIIQDRETFLRMTFHRWELIDAVNSNPFLQCYHSKPAFGLVTANQVTTWQGLLPGTHGRQGCEHRASAYFLNPCSGEIVKPIDWDLYPGT